MLKSATAEEVHLKGFFHLLIKYLYYCVGLKQRKKNIELQEEQSQVKSNTFICSHLNMGCSCFPVIVTS